MNKIGLYLVIVLATSSLAIMPASTLPAANTVLASYGAIEYLNLNRAVYIYGSSSLTDVETSYVASHFNLLICDFYMSRLVLQSIKSKNPNMIILGYKDVIGVHTSDSDWSTINSNEDWFLHDANGNRIKNTQYGWLLMDVGSSGWRQHYTSYLNNQLSQEFDGVFADDVWDTLRTDPWSNSSNLKSVDIANWHTNMIGMLQYVKNNTVSGKLVIVNTSEHQTHDYLDIVDGKVDEGFVHAGWWALNDFESSWFNPIDHINAMTRDSATGKIFISDNGAITPSNPDATVLAQIAQVVNYCYAGTLLGMNGPNSYFTFNNWWSNDNSRGYYGVMGTNLGSPLGLYYENQNVYVRDFAGGKVLFNPSNNSYNVQLTHSYFLPNGTSVSSITMTPWSGTILLSTPV